LGELHHALESGVLTNNSSIIELGQLTSKGLSGRDNEEQITVCDLTGTGVQDTVIALFAYNEMIKRNLGLRVENKTLSVKN
jgi:ornithine cyclodeaminase/alanine dehydrogenase-like protein (mu-crystallin family)